MTGGAAPSAATGTMDGQPLTFAARAMGSPLHLTVVTGRDSVAIDRAADTWAAVRDEFEASEQAMSRFRETSEITRLNRGAGRGQPVAVSRRLSRALAACDRAHRLTEGRFDPRVLRDLERLGDTGAPIAEVSATAESSIEARRLPACQRVIEREARDTMSLRAPVDLGGIGKGLALRWAARAVIRHGFAAFLLDAGGDLVAGGVPPDGGPWRIGVEDPAGGPEPLAVIAASDEAIATSSIRRRRWLRGDRVVHHLIDPLTGEPGGRGLLAVTVAGTDPAWAEVWSKTLFLEGRAGIAELARRRGLAAWWVVDDGTLEMTAAARQRTIWSAGDDR